MNAVAVMKTNDVKITVTLNSEGTGIHKMVSTTILAWNFLYGRFVEMR